MHIDVMQKRDCGGSLPPNSLSSLEGGCLLPDLPEDAIRAIISQLSSSDAASFRCVSRRISHMHCSMSQHAHVRVCAARFAEQLHNAGPSVPASLARAAVHHTRAVIIVDVAVSYHTCIWEQLFRCVIGIGS